MMIVVLYLPLDEELTYEDLVKTFRGNLQVLRPQIVVHGIFMCVFLSTFLKNMQIEQCKHAPKTELNLPPVVTHYVLVCKGYD